MPESGALSVSALAKTFSFLTAWIAFMCHGRIIHESAKTTNIVMPPANAPLTSVSQQLGLLVPQSPGFFSVVLQALVTGQPDLLSMNSFLPEGKALNQLHPSSEWREQEGK